MTRIPKVDNSKRQGLRALGLTAMPCESGALSLLKKRVVFTFIFNNHRLPRDYFFLHRPFP
jgi:hypothetical protein